MSVYEKQLMPLVHISKDIQIVVSRMQHLRGTFCHMHGLLHSCQPTWRVFSMSSGTRPCGICKYAVVRTLCKTK